VPHALARGTTTRPTSCIRCICTGLAKDGILRVRAHDAVLQLPLQVCDLYPSLVWRGPVLDPCPQLIEKPQWSSARPCDETVAHSGNFKVTVKVVYVWETPRNSLVVFLDALRRDQLVGLSFCQNSNSLKR